MAEALIRHHFNHALDVYSAGTKPSFVHPKAITVINELGIDMSTHSSKLITDIPIKQFDIVVTVCDNAKESCPFIPGKHTLIHQPFEDPADLTGTPEAILDGFKRIRDEISATFITTLPQYI